MSQRTELVFRYNSNLFPVGAKCSMCGQEMPRIQRVVPTSAAAILWFAEQFRIHKSQKHPPVKPAD